MNRCMLMASPYIVVRFRAGSHYGQTSRREAFGPMKMQKCPKFVLSVFTLRPKSKGCRLQKSLGGNTFRKLWRQEFSLLSQVWVEQNA